MHYRKVGLAVKFLLPIIGTFFDWRIGLGALIMWALFLIEWAVQKEPWKPKEPRYNFVPGDDT